MTDPLIDELLEGVTGAERERLARVHERLVAAGPPPELSPELALPPAPPRAPVVPFPRRFRFTAAAAALLAGLGLFGAGYLVGGAGGEEATVRTVVMTGADGAHADLALFRADPAGNWPMELTVVGLPALPDGRAYELWLTQDGERVESCGSFAVQGDGRTVVRLNAPYPLREFSGWVVAPAASPGAAVVLRTETV